MTKLICVMAFAGMMLWNSTNAHAERKSRFREGSEVRSTRTKTGTKSSAKSSARRATRPATTVVVPRDHNVVREEGQNVAYKRHNVVDFDDSLIEGEVKNPSEFYFVHRPEEKFGSLVKKRKNFHKEMLRDSVMIR